jgi:hypothetical protein
MSFRRSNIGQIKFEEGSRLAIVAELCFAQCRLRSIRLPGSLETIPDSCFEGADIEVLSFEQGSSHPIVSKDCLGSFSVKMIENPPNSFRLTGNMIFVTYASDDMIANRRKVQMSLLEVVQRRGCRRKNDPFDLGVSKKGTYNPYLQLTQSDRTIEILKRRELATVDWTAMELVNDIITVNQREFPGEDAKQIIELLRRVDLDIRIRDFVPSAELMKMNNRNTERRGVIHPSLNGILTHITGECKGALPDDICMEVPEKGEEPEYSCLGFKFADCIRLHGRFYGWIDHHDFREIVRRMGTDRLIYIDFKDRRIIPSHYCICGTMYEEPSPKKWAVEVSMDGKDWAEIDSREASYLESVWRVTRTYVVLKSQICRFIRIVNTGRDRKIYRWRDIWIWEIFGTVIE